MLTRDIRTCPRTLAHLAHTACPCSVAICRSQATNHGGTSEIIGPTCTATYGSTAPPCDVTAFPALPPDGWVGVGRLRFFESGLVGGLGADGTDCGVALGGDAFSFSATAVEALGNTIFGRDACCCPVSGTGTPSVHCKHNQYGFRTPVFHESPTGRARYCEACCA
jgi:hypothetical protein